MASNSMDGDTDGSAELKRVSEETAGRLRALGIVLDGRESSEDLVQLEDAIERFEEAVEAAGGDLMMDEGVGGPASQPDDPHFALPMRQNHETVGAYLERLSRATDDVWRHK
jgi:hypothetical protein